MPQTVAEAILELLAGYQVRFLFGNPGTTELPLVDALSSQQRIRYILGLHEVPVMSMADGWAQATRKLGFVNLHISCGLGNAMGMLYNAYRSGTPLLVTAGQQDRRLLMEEPLLWSEMERVARPWTKWAAEVHRAQDVLPVLRRAIQCALTPPTGPVFLSWPMDVQAELIDQAPEAVPLLDPRIRAPQAALQQAAGLLAKAENPVILAGSRVTEAGAIDALVQVAEALGAPVMAEPGTTHGRIPFPCTHPLSAPGLPLWSPEIRQRLEPFDVALVAGMDLFRQYVYHEPQCPVPEHLKLIHADQDPWQLGKNHPLAVGLWGHLQPTLEELAQLLHHAMSQDQRQRALARAEHHQAEHHRRKQQLEQRAQDLQDHRPLAPLVLMHTLAQVLPPDVAVVGEAVTTTSTTLERLEAIRRADGYFGHRGWALGWGLGCALGVKLAWPDRPVLAIVGEGAAMFGIQALWTAAHYRIPVTFVIPNNAAYQILKVGALGLQLPGASKGQFVGCDLVDPEIDFVALAQALGVKATTATEPDQVAELVRQSLAGDEPQLINVPIARELPGRLGYG